MGDRSEALHRGPICTSLLTTAQNRIDVMEHQWTALFYEADGMWVGTIAEILGVNTLGDTLDWETP